MSPGVLVFVVSLLGDVIVAAEGQVSLFRLLHQLADVGPIISSTVTLVQACGAGSKFRADPREYLLDVGFPDSVFDNADVLAAGDVTVKHMIENWLQAIPFGEALADDSSWKCLICQAGFLALGAVVVGAAVFALAAAGVATGGVAPALAASGAVVALSTASGVAATAIANIAIGVATIGGVAMLGVFTAKICEVIGGCTAAAAAGVAIASAS